MVGKPHWKDENIVFADVRVDTFAQIMRRVI